MRRAISLACVLACGAAHAGAPSPLWDDVVHPDRTRCGELVAEARKNGQANRRAIDLLNDAARRCPDRADVQAALGQALVDENQLHAARAALERARRLTGADDTDFTLAFNLGFVRTIEGDLEGGLVEYHRAAALGGLPPDRRWLIPYDIGDAYMALGRLEEAIAAYREAARATTVEQVPRLALAVALDRAEDWDAAREELMTVLRRDPRLNDLRSGKFVFVPAAELRYYVALAHLAGGRVSAGRAELRAFLAALPDGPYAARARAHLEQSTVLRPDDLLVVKGVTREQAQRGLAPILNTLELCLPPSALPPEPQTAAPLDRAIIRRVKRAWVIATTRGLNECIDQAIERANLDWPPDLEVIVPLAPPLAP